MDCEVVAVRAKDPAISFYLMITNDAYNADGASVPALDIVRHRLAQEAWPIYKGTKNRSSIRPGDFLLIYIAGRHEGRQCIVASTKVRSVEIVGNRPRRIDGHDVLTDPPYKVLRLQDTTWFPEPIPIRPFIGRLSFLPHAGARWSATIVGGCRSMSCDDFKAIMERARAVSAF